MAFAAGKTTPKIEQPAAVRAMSRAFADAAKAVRPSVVRIDVEQERPEYLHRRLRLPRRELPDLLERLFGAPLPDAPDFPGPGPLHGTGSGVVLDEAGHIVTNRHVIAGAGKVMVTLVDGRELPATVVGKDARTDLAVLRLEAPPTDLVVARLGDSDTLEVGEWVLATGSPLGLDQTVTAGIISGKGRAGRRFQMSGDRVRSYLQTDAKINPGNSGGPLVNLDGEVVGLNTLIGSGPGGSYGFAIPINEVRAVSAVLIKDGRVAYAYLGVVVGNLKGLDPKQRERLGKRAPETGVYIVEVQAGSPAAKAGLRAGDVITGLDEHQVDWSADVVDYVSSRPVGAKVAVRLLRDGKALSVQVTLGELPADEDQGQLELIEHLGLWLQSLTPELTTSLGLDPTTKGALVADLVPGGPAAKAGLAPGEVILGVDGQAVASAAEAQRAVVAPRAGGHVLRVRGPSGTRFVAVPAQ